MTEKKFNIVLSVVIFVIIGFGLFAAFVTQKNILIQGKTTSGEIISISKEYESYREGRYMIEEKYTLLIGVVGFTNQDGLYQTGSLVLGRVDGHKELAKATDLSGYEFGSEIEIKYIPGTNTIIRGGNYNEITYKKTITWIIGLLFIFLISVFGKRINNWGKKSALISGNKILEQIKKILNTTK